MGCGGNGNRVARHDALRNVMFTAAQSAALGPRKETPTLISHVQLMSSRSTGCSRCNGDFSSTRPHHPGASTTAGYALGGRHLSEAGHSFVTLQGSRIGFHSFGSGDFEWVVQRCR